VNLKNIVISLKADEAREVLAIEMDSDAKNALDFIKGILAKKVKRALESS
jgi:hypothetical protein